MKNLTMEIADTGSISSVPMEIVERKGLGHPDYICDAVMESISVALCKAYLTSFGAILHHNIDKGLLSAGVVEKHFGGGRVIEPMRFFVGDRATFSSGSRRVPVEKIAKEAMHQWFKENLPHVDPVKHVRPEIVLRRGSDELSAIFASKKKIMAANDTSAAVGYAPFSKTELTVLGLEAFLNSRAFKRAFPHTGQDVKIMAVRERSSLDVTVAMPLLASFVGSEKDYFSKKAKIEKAIASFVGARGFKRCNVGYNTLDRKGKGLDGVYLSLLGTSAEDADSGQVGRGNRVNGVISFNRPMSTEAAAGKNPVSHVGKIYNVMCHLLAGEIYEKVEGIDEVYVWLLSEIGSPVDKPKKINVKIVSPGKSRYNYIRRRTTAIIKEFLTKVPDITSDLAAGRYGIY